MHKVFCSNCSKSMTTAKFHSSAHKCVADAAKLTDAELAAKIAATTQKNSKFKLKSGRVLIILEENAFNDPQKSLL